ncbi:DUF1549 domain-containing protein [Stratiformator vulcanicus]|uniref:Translocation protein TolB n=1 Tax=Stratiformator vulcanicus TaxID=2527980 RepID=A0A517R5X1_9PLAN|nr:DUF1549 domain-containing protein [Stratiformator vulcanicus]QDT39260.1 translocation protein TolB [Stratiformator vulcanicus]
MLRSRVALLIAFTVPSVLVFGERLSAPAFGEETDGAKSVSFHKDVEPILRANCAGCHQPARKQGGYLMTDFDALVVGGESGLAAVVPGKPDASYLLDQIVPDDDGNALMPKNAPPLNPMEIDTIRKWILQGAKNDAPQTDSPQYSVENPPVYRKRPVVTSMDFSPDGGLLAVAGFHEVLLHDAESDEIVARLVGLSERIETVRFSPDGSKLAACGGLPGRTGEIQIWDVETRELLMAKTVGYDTVYGVSWSPDGSTVAIGCPDNTVRGFNADTGEQTFFMGGHNDWALDTVFSSDGSHVVSVGRDMTAKLTEVDTERFVDNITSITPGALKGGILAVAAHPERNEIVIGGSDGTPKVYRMFRQTKRVIGDDANLIRTLPSLPGRVFAIDVSTDGTRIAAGSSTTDDGWLTVYGYEFDTELTKKLKEAMSKQTFRRSAEEKKLLEEYRSEGVVELCRISIPNTPVYTVAFDPSGQKIVAAGGDGMLRTYNAETGEELNAVSSVPIAGPAGSTTLASKNDFRRFPLAAQSTSSSPATNLRNVTGLSVLPAEIVLQDEFDYVQLLVTASINGGSPTEVVTRAKFEPADNLVTVSDTGLVLPQKDGSGSLVVRVGDAAVTVPVRVSGTSTLLEPDFVRDVNPALTKLGCNQGTCHGAKDGKNGFKLSLRGYDPLYDVRAFRDDHAARRVNRASAADSLMLLKATGSVAHVGGQLTRKGEGYYEIIRRWIEDGSQLDLDTPRVERIELQPQKPVVPLAGETRQFRVTAYYSDGRSRDVTREAFVESGDIEIASALPNGVMRAMRRGESPVLARYEGAYAATTLTVMGDRDGFTWQEPEKWTAIDEFVARKWERMKIRPSGLSSDADFIRRVYLDLTGLPPSVEEVKLFLADRRPDRVKRDELIDRLIGSEEYVDRWTNKWADLLQVNSKFLGDEGAKQFHAWIREQVETNRPYDEFARDILTATGSNRENPAASYYKVLRDPLATMENTTHLFLAVRFNCNKCHDHPFERWTQDQYYETAAFFGRVGLKKDPASKNRNIGGTAVEGATPLFEVVYDKESGEVKHDRTGVETAPEFPYEATFSTADDASRREKLAAWMTSPDNQYFATSYVNRLWGYLLGVGLIEPLDDIRAGNPPTNPELLDYLTREFLESGFNTQHVIRLICQSRTYQLSVESNKWNADDSVNYSHAIARRLPAEMLYDSLHKVLGSKPDIPTLPGATRAAALPDAQLDAKSGFLANFGRPARESACECERSTNMELGNVMTLISGSTLAEAIASPSNELTALVRREKNDREMFRQIFLRILNRPATEAEIDAAIKSMNRLDNDHARLQAALTKREIEVAPIRAERELVRAKAIAAARTELDEYKASNAEKVAKREADRQAKIDAASAELQAFEDQFDSKLSAWEQSIQSESAVWSTLDPHVLVATNGAKLKRLDDGSFLASGNPDRTKFRIVADVPMTRITGIRIEALPHESLPKNGPGRSEDGRFILTELSGKARGLVSTGDVSGPVVAQKNVKENTRPGEPLKFGEPVANDAAGGYPVKEAVDGNRSRNDNGWSVDRNFGQVQWAVFPLKQPIEGEIGVRLEIELLHDHLDDNSFFGRFRIDVTEQADVSLGVPRELFTLLETPAEDRTAQQWVELTKTFRLTDPEYNRLTSVLAAARKPLPEDPKVTGLENRIERLSRPLPEDPLLERLRTDFAMSKRQLGDKRLIAAQDLAWVLINSPSFLFNH